jgi:hypothetical protein
MRCVICCFEMQPDDIALLRGEGCICTACYDRIAGRTVRMSRTLRREVIQALYDAEHG